MTVGYSGTPLSKKLGITPGMAVATIGAPDNYSVLLDPVPDDVSFSDSPGQDVDLVHLFTNSWADLIKELSNARKAIKQDGTIWVSWYKKAAKLPTEITEDRVRDAAFPLGLVDIKVCAVDEKWSGLKLVIRRENRI